MIEYQKAEILGVDMNDAKTDFNKFNIFNSNNIEIKNELKINNKVLT